MPGGAFPHYPAHCVNRVGFATTIRTDNTCQVATQVNSGGINEGFEACKFDFAESHVKGVSVL